MKEKTFITKLSGVSIALALIITMLPWQVMADDSALNVAPVTPETEATVNKEDPNAEQPLQPKEIEKQADLAETLPASSAPKSNVYKFDIDVVYENGEPVKNGYLFDLMDVNQNMVTSYEVVNGKLEGVRLLPGKEYDLGQSWDCEDEDFFDYSIVEQNPKLGTVPLTVSSTGKLVWFDRNTNKADESKPITKITLKKNQDEPPQVVPDPTEKVKVQKGEETTLKDITVEMEDGTPAPDGIIFDLFDMQKVYSDPEHFEVKDGKLSGIKLKAEQQYKLGMDVKNPYYSKYIVKGAYSFKSQHLIRIFARYANEAPLYYDYDEGITGKEAPIEKIILHEVKDQNELDKSRPTSCIMTLILSDNGYAAEGELPFRLINKDNGKSKVVYSKDGELTITANAGIPYELKLDANETYTLKDKIEFTIKMDQKGKYQPVIEGYDVEDSQGHLQCRYIELTRIDGNASAGKKIEEEDECEQCTKFKPADYAKIYVTDKVKLQNMPVYEKTASGDYRPLKKDVTFLFYDATAATVENRVTAKNGVLPDVEMIKGHDYIVYAEDPDYEMPNAYMMLNETGAKPQPTKQNGRKVDAFYMIKRPTSIANFADAKRVHYELPVYYTKDGANATPVDNVKFKFTSAYETVTATAVDGFIEYDLIEDMNYMVNVDDPRYSMDTFPMTMKDKSEWGAKKYAFNHLSCGSVNQLVVKDKTEADKNNNYLIDCDKTVILEGMNFGNGDYLVNARNLPKDTVKGLEGKDYEVIDVDTINMYRTELSKLAIGNFKVSRLVPNGKKVKQVYYVDNEGKLVKVPFVQKEITEGQNAVIFDMPCMSMYNNVIEYGEPEVVKPEPSNDDKNQDTQNTKAEDKKKSDYYVKEGANAAWKQGDKDLLIVIKSKINDGSTFTHFKGIEIDGVEIARNNYDALPGSVRISLHAKYLKSLKPGKHTMVVKFDNGTIASDFNIAPTDASGAAESAVLTDVAKTGDANSFGFVIALAISLAALLAVFALRKRVIKNNA